MWTQENWYNEAKNYAIKHREFVKKMTRLTLELLKKHIPEKSEDEIKEFLIEYSNKRINAPVDLKKYVELRGMKELILAEWKGIKDGAGIDDGELAIYTNGFHFYHRIIATGKLGKMDGFSQKAGCSYIFFPHSDYGPLLANNLDTSPEEPFGPPEWPALNEHLIIGTVSSGVFLDEEPEEIFPAPVFRIVARYCRNAAEAAEMLEKYNQFWGPCNAIVVDRDKRCAMIEKSSCRIGVRWSKDGFGFITAMTAEHPEMNAYLNDRRQASLKARNLKPGNCDEIYWQKQDSRRKLMNTLLEKARENPTLKTMRKFIQFRDPEKGNVCGNGEIYAPGCPQSEYTVRTIIWLLKEGRALWWARQKDKPSFENPMPEVKFENVFLWD
ncbi:MAG: hypothetical protein NC902_03055 [Candidatus Omnitrophica bacterium]|nr:hypothetical protein [Candidatus Omnitrophota bacterium]